MNYALIVYRNDFSDGICEAVFKYKTDAEHLAENVYSMENVHTAVVRLGTGEVVAEFET